MEHFANTNLQESSIHKLSAFGKDDLEQVAYSSYCQPSVIPRMAINNHQDSYLMTIHLPSDSGISRNIIES